MSVLPRFYTLPPLQVPYPYILINANNPSTGLTYISRNREIIESVIIDSGVEIFRDKNTREYPGGPEKWTRRLAELYRKIKRICRDCEAYATIPDYPDDYHPRSLWLSGETTNIERTLANIKLAIEKHGDIDWLIPVQGHYEKPESIVYSIELMQELGIIDWAKQHTNYYAVAMLCVSRKCSVIEKTIQLAWKKLPVDARIHVFGPAVNCMKRVWRIIYSFDSTAWTKPRTRGGSSAWSEKERIYLFINWLMKYSNMIEVPEIPKSMKKRIEEKKAHTTL